MLPKPYCPYHAAEFLVIEAGNSLPFKCTHNKCPHPHLDDANLRQELKRGKPAAVKFLLDHFDAGSRRPSTSFTILVYCILVDPTTLVRSV